MTKGLKYVLCFSIFQYLSDSFTAHAALVTLRGTDEESDDDRLSSSRPPRKFSAFFNRIPCDPRIALNGSFAHKNEFAQKTKKGYNFSKFINESHFLPAGKNRFFLKTSRESNLQCQKYPRRYPLDSKTAFTLTRKTLFSSQKSWVFFLIISKTLISPTGLRKQRCRF